ncbi:ABC transporter ATP-binding protein [Anoxybacterium hadale]|uniref:ABC transporter ATP-binding protein n=1 Tax=Anoxybacterium hadale TaxID=3408580 RepID=A0ACD1A7C6_9FIRM|nr:ABC transporter ATP-binding protein [Clostridiales bacterium]
MFNLKEALMLTAKGYSDLKKAIAACTLTNLSLMLPFLITIQLFAELLKPLMGQEISWNKMWAFLGFGVVAAVLVFLASKNDYKKTYVTSYMEAEHTRVSVAERIRKLPMSFFNSKDLTELTTNIMADCTTTEHVLSHIIPQLISNGISITLVCAMMAAFDWRMAIAVFCSVPVALLVILGSKSFQRRLSEKHVESKLRASGQVQEYLEGIKVIKACGLDGSKFAKLDEALRLMKKMAMKMEFGTGIFVTGAQMLLQAGIGLTVFVGAHLLTKGSIELIPLLMFLVIVVRIYGPIMVEFTLLPELFYHRISTKRMRTLMTAPIMEGNAEAKLTQWNIEFEGVSFSYDTKNAGTDSVIKDLTVSFPSDAITALVGPSGCGKSTVSRLIARFWDVNKGRVKVGGVDVKTLDPEHLMSYMSFVFQDVVLFNDTVYNNIKIGNMNASEEEVIAAAKAACCDDFIKELPSGYQTMLGENGSTLSGGERQRISIARALLKNAPIVLLDEATASLDPENEALIQQAISRLIEGKTVIVIAHRLRTIAGADKIVVLEDGKLAEEGTHDALMEKKGLYERLYTIQQESLGWSV